MSLVSHIWNSLCVPVEMLPMSAMPGPLDAEIPALALLPTTCLFPIHFRTIGCECISCQRAPSCDRNIRGEREREETSCLLRRWVAYLWTNLSCFRHHLSDERNIWPEMWRSKLIFPWNTMVYMPQNTEDWRCKYLSNFLHEIMLNSSKCAIKSISG